jgi:hypothetical protein
MSATEKVTLNDALSNVDVLDELPLPDEQPCIEVMTIFMSWSKLISLRNAFVAPNYYFLNQKPVFDHAYLAFTVYGK